MTAVIIMIMSMIMITIMVPTVITVVIISIITKHIVLTVFYFFMIITTSVIIINNKSGNDNRAKHDSSNNREVSSAYKQQLLFRCERVGSASEHDAGDSGRDCSGNDVHRCSVVAITIVITNSSSRLLCPCHVSSLSSPTYRHLHCHYRLITITIATIARGARGGVKGFGPRPHARQGCSWRWTRCLPISAANPGPRAVSSLLALELYKSRL